MKQMRAGRAGPPWGQEGGRALGCRTGAPPPRDHPVSTFVGRGSHGVGRARNGLKEVGRKRRQRCPWGRGPGLRWRQRWKVHVEQPRAFPVDSALVRSTAPLCFSSHPEPLPLPSPLSGPQGPQTRTRSRVLSDPPASGALRCYGGRGAFGTAEATVSTLTSRKSVKQELKHCLL